MSQNIVGADGILELVIGSQAPIAGRSDAEISTLYVQPRHQGKGKGTALLEAGLELARTKGCTSVWLTLVLPKVGVSERADFVLRHLR